VVGLIAVPIVLEVAALGHSWRHGNLGIDIKHGLLPVAELVRHGISPFVLSHYPPLVPVLLVPFTFVSSAPVLLSVLAALCVPLTLWALDIRDWRCYGAAFLWPPVFSGIQTANVTLFLVLGSALAWRWRERPGACAASAGLAIGAKLINLPLVLWLAATGRVRAAAGSVAIAVAATLGLGLSLELALQNDSSGTGSRFGTVITDKVLTPSYSIVDVSRSLGASTTVAFVALGVLMVALMGLCVVRGRRGDDVACFSFACLGCLVAAPNVWLHSFGFLLPIVALARPRLSPAWLVPVVFVVAPVIDPSAVEVAVAWLTTAALGFHLLRTTKQAA
jgi:hypothetical protein